MRVSLGCLLVAVVLPHHTPAEVQAPSAVCTSQTTPLSIRLGEGIPLPREFSNPTNDAVTFVVRMHANALFGPNHELTRVRVPAKTSRSYSAVHLTRLSTPLGSARVVINIRTDRSNSPLVGRCDYQLTLTPPLGVAGKVPVVSDLPRPQQTPQELSWLYQVPVRMCVLEGSAWASNKRPGEVVTGDPAKAMVELLESVDRDIWFPHAQIAFSTAIETGFPVVAGNPVLEGSCRTGDLKDVTGFGYGDAPFAETACDAAWQQKYPGRRGVPIVFARRFCGVGRDALGGAPQPDSKLYVAGGKSGSGQRGDDLCGSPQRLTRADITNTNRRPFVAVVEPAAGRGNARNALAHELGHNLFLGHGNGLDDNRDGLSAGRPGPRRYDEYCDPAWLLPGNQSVAEDQATDFADCDRTGSLMAGYATCPNLQPLQVETARGVARVMPGFVDGTPRASVRP